MTNKAPDELESQKETEQERHYRWMHKSSQDGLLQSLSALLERTYPENKIGIGITLSSGGMLVSGQLICAQWYFEQLGELLTKSPAPAPSLVKMTEGFSNGVKEALEAHDKAEEPYVPNFVHLMNAKFYVPGQPPLLNGVLWRGRISAVDGVVLGTLNPTS